MVKKIKYLLLSIVMIFLVSLVSCENDTTEKIALPDLTGMSRETIKLTLDKLNISYQFAFSDIQCTTEDEYDKFVAYDKGYTPNTLIDKSTTIIVYTTRLHLDFNYLDEVKLDQEYEGKSFIDDGIGEVKLVRSVDGDTARFIDPYSKTIKTDFSVRFLGINTPESTIKKAPWGKTASDFTKKKLEQAQTIVLESEGARTETYGRYLAFVWVDGILLNLELVQEAYSPSTLSSSSKYFSVMIKAFFSARATGRRYHGEIDPHYDYERQQFI